MRLKNFKLNVGAQIFKAFSDVSRIRIMHLLYKCEEMCISDLEQILDFTQTKISRHLTYLKNSELVTFRKVDQWAYYSVKEEVGAMIEQIFSFLEKDDVLIEDLKNYRTLYNNNVLSIRELHNKQNIYKLPEL